MAKQYNLFGEAVNLPTAKRPKIVGQVETYKSSWTNSAPWPRACALLVVPVHTADCERGFSALGRIKTKNRSCLTNQYLKSLLLISLEGPPINKFDFQCCMKD